MSASRPCFGGEVSLRSLLERAVFVGADDIRARRCVGRADQCRPGDLFVPQAFSRDRRNGSGAGSCEARRSRRRFRAAVACFGTTVPGRRQSQAFGVICQALAGSPSLRHVIDCRGWYAWQNDRCFILVVDAQGHRWQRGLLHIAGFERFGHLRSCHDPATVCRASWPIGCVEPMWPVHRRWWSKSVNRCCSIKRPLASN